MDISKLELFLDIIETKNLTLSGERLGYTQSGVSHAIRKLESELGIALITRTNHGVEVTTDGNLILPHLRSIVSNYHRLNDTLDSIQDLQRGSITIGTYSSIASHWLPEVIRKFTNSYPNVSITIREAGMDTLEQWLLNGTIDLAFGSWKKHPNYNFHSLARDPLCAIVGKDYPINPDYLENFPMHAFEEFPFIASVKGVDYDVADAFKVSSVDPLVSFKCSDDHTIISMVSKGLGVSLLPQLFVAGFEHLVQVVPIKPCFMRTLGIYTVSEDTMSLAAKKFLKLATDLISTQLQNETNSSIL